MAKKRGVLTKLFGPDSMARQFFVWNVAAEIVSTAMSPFVQVVSNTVNSMFPEVPPSPAELAGMVLRGVAGNDWAVAEAKKSGISPEIFDLMVKTAGGPPAIGDMLHLMRRGKVSRDDVIRAIKQSDVKNEWIDTILKLGVQPPTPTDILEAYLEGQVGEARARELFVQLGGDPEFFELLYNTRGSAPTPEQAAEMANRGIIPWAGSGPGATSFEQSFLEGPWRNKWMPAFRKAAEYTPPPETIGAMFRRGAIPVDRAHELLAARGIPPLMYDAYLFDDADNAVGEAKKLTESTVSTLYQELAINDAAALEMLGKLKYAPPEAKFIVTAWKLNRELRFRNSAISTVHTQYINHRIEKAEVSQALDKFGVPPAQRDALIMLWTEEEKAKVAVLTPAQVKRAMMFEIITPDEALKRLKNYGYNEPDAMIFLSI